MEIFNSFLSADADIPTDYPVKSFFNYIANTVNIEGFIAVAGFLSPDIVQSENLILLSENYKILNENLKKKLNYNSKDIERYVNLFCVSDFYLFAANDASSDSNLQKRQGEIIIEFWKKRLFDIFPDILFDFELSTDGIFDEDGVCITFSQHKSF